MFKFLIQKIQPLIALVIALSVLSGCELAEPVSLTKQVSTAEAEPQVGFAEKQPISGQYIVVLKETAVDLPALPEKSGKRDDAPAAQPATGFVFQNQVGKRVHEQRRKIVRAESEKMLEQHGISVNSIAKVFSNDIQAVLVKAETEAINGLRNDPRVAYVEQDQIVALNASPLIKTPFIPSGTLGTQNIPYGVNRVGGSRDFENHPDNILRWAWIMDTGIDMDHEDLIVDTHFSRDFTKDDDLDDMYGHGTHVAGIIAAKDNGIGVTGVAAGATLVNIKVLDYKGKGKASDIVAGLDWIAAMAWPNDVVNMSLGGIKSQAIDDAVKRVADNGIKVVIAAGNEAKETKDYSPARVDYTNIYTVGSIGNGDTFSYFSNYGSEVDFLAPGEDILSTYKNNEYGWMSGTSMAAPHVTGVLILAASNFTTSGTVSDPNGSSLGVIYHNE